MEARRGLMEAQKGQRLLSMRPDEIQMLYGDEDGPLALHCAIGLGPTEDISPTLKPPTHAELPGAVRTTSSAPVPVPAAPEPKKKRRSWFGWGSSDPAPAPAARVAGAPPLSPSARALAKREAKAVQKAAKKNGGKGGPTPAQMQQAAAAWNQPAPESEPEPASTLAPPAGPDAFGAASAAEAEKAAAPPSKGGGAAAAAARRDAAAREAVEAAVEVLLRRRKVISFGSEAAAVCVALVAAGFPQTEWELTLTGMPDADLESLISAVKTEMRREDAI